MDNSTRLVSIFNNLTVSGTLQSFQTSLLATSSVIDGKISSQIGISNVNLDNRINLFGVSSSVMDGKLELLLEFLFHSF